MPVIIVLVLIIQGIVILVLILNSAGAVASVAYIAVFGTAGAIARWTLAVGFVRVVGILYFVDIVGRIFHTSRWDGMVLIVGSADAGDAMVRGFLDLPARIAATASQIRME